MNFERWVENRQEKKDFVQSVIDKYGKKMPPIDTERYTPIEGLEGPFRAKNGRVVYYDPKEGKYYDRDTDMYLDGPVMEANNMALNTNDMIQGIKQARTKYGVVGLSMLASITHAIEELAKQNRVKADILIKKIAQAIAEFDKEIAQDILSKKAQFLNKAQISKNKK